MVKTMIKKMIQTIGLKPWLEDKCLKLSFISLTINSKNSFVKITSILSADRPEIKKNIGG